MKSKTLSDRPGAQVHVVILDAGEEAFATLTKFANEAKIAAAALTAIGAFESAVVGWFDFASIQEDRSRRAMRGVERDWRRCRR
jgi:predicted DNA-binding protein with PD1-like motif